jgi:hypothetical protein
MSPISTVAAALREIAVAAGTASASQDAQARSRTLSDLNNRLGELEATVSRLEDALKQQKLEPPPAPRTVIEPVKREAASRKADPGGPPAGEPSHALPPNWRLAQVCEDHGLEVIDRRDVPGGSLWVVGPREVAQPLFRMFSAEGVSFAFVPGGSRATGRRPGWFTKSQR